MKFSTLVTATSGGLLCQAVPGQCLPGAKADAVSATIEERQDLFFPDNENRRDRVVQLRADITSMENVGANFWESYDEKSDFYKATLDEIAVTKGYTDAKEMLREKILYAVYPIVRPDIQDALDDYSAAEDVSTVMTHTAGAIMAISMPAEYALQRHRLVLSEKNGLSGALSNSKTRWKAKLEVSKARFEWITGKIDRATMDAKVNTARASVADLELKGGWKWLSRFTSVLEIADLALWIGELIYEGVEGRNQKNQLKETIDELAAARFATYSEMKAMDSLRDWNDQVFASFLNRASLQNLVNGGHLCYEAAEDELRTQLTSASDQYFNEVDEDLEAWYEELVNGFDSEAWTDDDPDFEDIMTALAAAEAEYNAENPPTPDETPEGEYILTGTDVPADELHYFEFTGGKGAVWKLNGPQWSIQFPFDTQADPVTEAIDIDGDGVLPTGDPRAEIYSHHMLQLQQTQYPNKIFLQSVEVYDAENEVFSGHGDITVIDLDNYVLKKIVAPGEDWISVPESSWADWFAGYEISIPTLHNQIQQNAWTASAVVSENGEGFQPHYAECNKNVGWDFEGASGNLHRVREISRDATSIGAMADGYTPTVAVDGTSLAFDHTTCTNPAAPPWNCPGWETTAEDYTVVYFLGRQVFA